VKRGIGLVAVAAAMAFAVPASAQVTQDMCGSTGLTQVCVRGLFTLTSTTLTVDLFNGVGTASSVAGTLNSWDFSGFGSYGGTWSLTSASFVNGGASTPLTVGSGNNGDVLSNGALHSIHLADNGGTSSAGNGGIATCAGPTSRTLSSKGRI